MICVCKFRLSCDGTSHPNAFQRIFSSIFSVRPQNALSLHNIIINSLSMKYTRSFHVATYYIVQSIARESTFPRKAIDCDGQRNRATTWFISLSASAASLEMSFFHSYTWCEWRHSTSAEWAQQLTHTSQSILMGNFTIASALWVRDAVKATWKLIYTAHATLGENIILSNRFLTWRLTHTLVT